MKITLAFPNLKTKFTSRVILITALLTLWQTPFVHAQEITADPLEGMNRNVNGFNQFLDKYLMKPVAKSYHFVMPNFAERGVSNFFQNLDDVNVVVNDLLQLKISYAAQDASRFLLNSTVGIAGVFDVASGVGLEKHDEDFGQTLGYWGVDSGAYVVLPFFGSSNVRDSVGMIPDLFFNPTHWIEDSKVRLAAQGLDAIDTRVSLFAAEELISGDEYLFVRDAFVQRREYLVADGEVYDEFDDF